MHTCMLSLHSVMDNYCQARPVLVCSLVPREGVQPVRLLATKPVVG